ncbi:hypothetical protein L0F63_007188, partial [Massospora cicadina]
AGVCNTETPSPSPSSQTVLTWFTAWVDDQPTARTGPPPRKGNPVAPQNSGKYPAVYFHFLKTPVDIVGKVARVALLPGEQRLRRENERDERRRVKWPAHSKEGQRRKTKEKFGSSLSSDLLRLVHPSQNTIAT